MLLLRNLNLLLSMLPSQRELYTGVSQKGILVGLKIVRDEKKSWCLFVDQFIKKGQFICEYAGHRKERVENHG
ncbi:hypothetical protein AALP_AA4G068100 [Arabis alpina]|uniref:SET domain-containing protein n=1 Tax=Arabis alpina TaxID=50452 RepID=A0A087H1M3_ARAAL|nr:hypothetical protein AALP_AA4G068100 [Arabis alpina]